VSSPCTYGIALTLACLSLMVGACGDTGKTGRAGTSCSMKQNGDGAITVSCEDGTSATLNPPIPTPARDGGESAESCRYERGANSVVITCPDGSKATIPTLPALGQDAGHSPVADASGAQACTVEESGEGNLTVTCPDGSSATIPVAPTTPASSVRLLGAAAASCGTCHDTASAKAHFKVMTVDLDAGVRETCGTCHGESGVEPVSRAHLQPELGLPGLAIQIESASIDASTRKVSAWLKLSDKSGNPLAREGVLFNFVIAKVSSITSVDGTQTLAGAYQSYLSRSVTQKDNADYPLGSNAPRTVAQPTSEAGTGTFRETNPDSGDGRYVYTFSSALPVDYDASATHVLALYATRTVEGTRFVANATRFFVPSDASAAPLKRDTVRTETCNQCHAPLSAHGGARQDVQLCLTCHSEGAIDPESENELDLNVMIHRIHRGKALPSVRAGTPYSIVGYGNQTQDFSDVGYPQPIENCQSCHTATDSERWVTNGTRKVCTSCHELIDKPWEEGGHPFALEADANCSNGNCHGAGGKVRDAREAHLTFLNDARARVFKLELVSVTAAHADAPIQVRIRARVGRRNTLDAALTKLSDSANFASLEVFLNGPNTGYLRSGNTLTRHAKAALAGLAADSARPGEFTFSLPGTLRSNVVGLGDPALDSYTLSVNAVYDPTPSTAPDDDRLRLLDNPSLAFSASEPVTARRAVVRTERCNSCHGALKAHEDELYATNVEQCAMCHTGSLDTRVRQASNKVPGPTRSLRFSTLIHRVHGERIATAPYVLFGDDPNLTTGLYPSIDFSRVPFPGDVRVCTTCHESGTYLLPLPELDPPTETVTLDADGKIFAP